MQKINFITENDKIVALEVTQTIDLQDEAKARILKTKLEKLNQIRLQTVADMQLDIQNDIQIIQAINNFLLSQ